LSPRSLKLGVSSVSLLAVAAADELTVNFVWGVMQAVVPALLMNVFIVGLNQLTDVDIDKARAQHATDVRHAYLF
jgi:homogentisate phytyltransferase / homogentisate geranylgeranyltransferase